jgi:hypothetical protein
VVDPFVRALIIATIIVAVIDAIVFYRLWRNRKKNDGLGRIRTGDLLADRYPLDHKEQLLSFIASM